MYYIEERLFCFTWMF